MKLLLNDIKSIHEGVYEFPEKGVVRISGGNSNGKSIAVDTLASITKLTITNTKKRRAIIRDGCASASVLMLREDGRTLLCKLHEDSAQCAFFLKRANGETIGRSFREGGLEELLYEFGWRTYANNALCLQIHETFGLAPFVNTTLSQNCDMVEAMTTDDMAEEYIRNFKEVTYPAAKAELTKLNDRYTSLSIQHAKMVMYDYVKYSEVYDRMSSCLNVLNFIRIMELDPIKLPPNIEYYDIYRKPLEPVRVVIPMPFAKPLESLADDVRSIDDLKVGKCPLCGATITDEEVHQHVG